MNDREKLFLELVRGYRDSFTNEYEREDFRDLANTLARTCSMELIYWLLWNLGNRNVFQFKKMLFSEDYRKECERTAIIASELYDNYENITDELKQKLLEPKTIEHPYTHKALERKRQIQEIMNTEFNIKEPEIIEIDADEINKRKQQTPKYDLLPMDMYDDDTPEETMPLPTTTMRKQPARKPSPNYDEIGLYGYIPMDFYN